MFVTAGSATEKSRPLRKLVACDNRSCREFWRNAGLKRPEDIKGLGGYFPKSTMRMMMIGLDKEERKSAMGPVVVGVDCRVLTEYEYLGPGTLPCVRGLC